MEPIVLDNLWSIDRDENGYWLSYAGQPMPLLMDEATAYKLADQIMAWQVEKEEFEASIGSVDHNKKVTEEYAND